MNKSLIIFDMDGLMIDSERKTFDCYKFILSQMGLEISSDFYLSILGRPMTDIKQAFKKEYGSDFNFEGTALKVHERLNNSFKKDGVPIKDGLLELLKYLSSLDDITLVVATSSDRHRVENILHLANISKYFDFYICGDEVKKGKPNPEVFLKCCEKAGCKPEEAIVLEDSEMGILASHGAGITCIAVPDMKWPEIEFRRKAYLIADSLFDVLDIFENTKEFSFEA